MGNQNIKLAIRQTYQQVLTGNWSVRSPGQGCLLSHYLFNIFLQQIIIDTLERFQGTVSISDQIVSKLRFADDINLLAGSEEELIDNNNCCSRSQFSNKVIST